MSAFDLVVIGGGPGGYPLALRMARHGWRTALIDEASELGGTCLNWGCIPTKALLASAHQFHQLKHAENMGLLVDNPRFDWQRIQSRKNDVVTRLRAGIGQMLKKAGVAFFPGRARLQSATRISIQTGAERQEIDAERVVLAVGSKPAVPKVFPQNRHLFWTSDEALQADSVPESLLIVGGGVIGLELGQVFAEFGSRVTIVEMMPQILPGLDAATAKRLLPVFRKQGLEILVGRKVEGLQEKDGLVAATIAEQERTFTRALLAIGRSVNLSCLEESGVQLELDQGRIKVNEHLETSVPGIYAIGDAVAGPMLAHKASYDAMILARRFAGAEVTPSYRAVPSCVFTYPEIAWVGLSEEEARQSDPNVSIGKFLFSANGKALAAGNAEGQVKTMVGSDGTIQGAVLWGPEVSNLITEPTLLRELAIPAGDFISVIHAHPTLPEAFFESVEQALGQGAHG